MNALKPLAFPDASFDLVNARVIIGFMRPSSLPSFLQECKRILKPSGTLRMTEGEWGFTNSAALETFLAKAHEALHRVGYNYSPTGRNLGLTAVLPTFIRQTGFEDVQLRAHAIESSAGTAHQEATYQDFKLMFRLGESYYLQMKVFASKAEFDQLYEQVMTDIQADTFCCMSYMLTVWGTKP